MGTKNNPGEFDCLDTALPDEPVFVLLGRDTQAPGLVHMWAFEREQGIAEGRFPESDRAKVAEALRLATQMIEWRQRNDGAWREKNPELPLAAEPAGEIARGARFMDDVPGSVKALTDPLPGPPLFPADFAITLHGPAATAAEAARRDSPDYPEL